MICFITGNGYRLPFKTIVFEKFVRNHQHRDRQGLVWSEQMELSVRFIAFHVSAIVPANNDNELLNHG